MSLKDKIEGNVLDLSLNQLTDVPVKELAAAPKATHLDLSCNLIQSLPNDFCTLTHLVKIDLNRNQLSELPQNFGNLINLQYLDLDKNKLKTLPISFCYLKNLRWLDLKDNPLGPDIKAVAGDCLDEKQCQACAKKVVSFMQNIQSAMERDKQKMLKKVREEQALQKAKAEKELEEQRKLKKIEKERRKAESKAKNQEKMQQDKHEFEKNIESDDEIKTNEIVSAPPKSGLHWSIWLLLLFIAILSAIYFSSSLKNIPIQDISFSDIQLAVKDLRIRLFKSVEKYWKEIISQDISSAIKKYSLGFGQSFVKFCNSTLIPYSVALKTAVLRVVHSSMIFVSNMASKLEAYLSVYF